MKTKRCMHKGHAKVFVCLYDERKQTVEMIRVCSLCGVDQKAIVRNVKPKWRTRK